MAEKVEAAEKEKKIPTIDYKYIIKLPSGETRTFAVQLEEETLNLRFPHRTALPDWTALSYKQCPNCPLNEKESPRCPAAVSIADIVETFSTSISHDEVLVRVESPERVYEKKVPLQKVLSGLIGLLMAASGCPVTGKLKPLVRHHLPFSNLEETQFRILSMYLMAQYLRVKNGKEADWSLETLQKIYDEIRTVNSSFFNRVLGNVKGDANPNALVILGAFTEAIAFSTKGMMLETLEQIYKTYLE
ncbi:MAG: hypothetical protein NC819_00790 [Candidatus Omnitrophica bacterium]|nr:hypothetical protein [Candidatus Omnitrophota bacterium]